MKVWAKLNKGGIANFIENLHGWKSVVIELMVNTWKDGKIMIDDITF